MCEVLHVPKMILTTTNKKDVISTIPNDTGIYDPLFVTSTNYGRDNFEYLYYNIQ